MPFPVPNLNFPPAWLDDPPDRQTLTDFAHQLAVPLEDLMRAWIARLQAHLPDSNDAVYTLQNIGKCYLHRGLFGQARYWYHRALDHNPNDAWTHLYLGNLAYTLGQYRAALRWFNRSSELMPQIAVPWWCLGDVYAASGQLTRAEESYLHATLVEPGDPRALSRLRDLYESRIRTQPLMHSPNRHAYRARRGIRRPEHDY